MPPPHFTKKLQALPTGITLGYVEAGHRGGEVVIFLHGYTDSARSFFPTLEALVAAHTRLHLYALDQRGHGASSLPTSEGCADAPEQCLAMGELARDVLAFMDEQRIAKAHVVGHSMGGLVAQELALAAPDRIESLMLLDSWVSGADNPAIEQFLLPIVEGAWRDALMAQPGFRYPRDAYLLTPEAADPDAPAWVATEWVTDVTAEPRFLAQIVPETAAVKLGTWIGALRAQAAFDSRARLAELRVPTLAIWATQDFIWPYEPFQTDVIAALQSAIDAGHLEYFFYKTYGKRPLPESGFQESDLGHNVTWGAAEAVAVDLTAWVSKRRPTTGLPYADSDDPTVLRIEPNAAVLIERRRAPR